MNASRARRMASAILSRLTRRSILQRSSHTPCRSQPDPRHRLRGFVCHGTLPDRDRSASRLRRTVSSVCFWLSWLRRCLHPNAHHTCATYRFRVSLLGRAPGMKVGCHSGALWCPIESISGHCWPEKALFLEACGASYASRNPKVGGSNPPPATLESPVMSVRHGAFCLLQNTINPSRHLHSYASVWPRRPVMRTALRRGPSAARRRPRPSIGRARDISSRRRRDSSP